MARALLGPCFHRHFKNGAGSLLKINFFMSHPIRMFAYMANLLDGTYAPTEMVKKQFLELFIDTGHIADTCRKLNLHRRTLYHWRVNDPEFMEQFKLAEFVATTILEDEAFRRAVQGIPKPVYQGGKHVGDITEYSDMLLAMLLKARLPQRYKERWQGEIVGADGKAVNPNKLEVVHVTSDVPLATSESDIETNYIEYDEDELSSL